MYYVLSAAILGIVTLGVVWILRKRSFTFRAGVIVVDVHHDEEKEKQNKRKNAKGLPDSNDNHLCPPAT